MYFLQFFDRAVVHISMPIHCYRSDKITEVREFLLREFLLDDEQ